jgi:4-hydroxybutyryl-CoA dehydratase/vinylacetyl-CoA-Delta-isomerase
LLIPVPERGIAVMALMTREQYIDSLRKLKRDIYILGEKVDNVVDHPMVRP